MKYVYLGVMLVLSSVISVAPPVAAQSASLPYNLTFSGTSSAGTITGAWGGLLVQGTYSGNRWTILTEGSPAVVGTYECDVACTFAGVVDDVRPTPFALHPVLGDDMGSSTVSGSLALNLRPPAVWF